MTLTCTKAGRYWPVQSIAAGTRAAVHLGLKDYTIEPA